MNAAESILTSSDTQSESLFDMSDIPEFQSQVAPNDEQERTEKEPSAIQKEIAELKQEVAEREKILELKERIKELEALEQSANDSSETNSTDQPSEGNKEDYEDNENSKVKLWKKIGAKVLEVASSEAAKAAVSMAGSAIAASVMTAA